MAAATLSHIPTSMRIAMVRLICASLFRAALGQPALAFQTLL